MLSTNNIKLLATEQLQCGK